MTTTGTNAMNVTVAQTPGRGVSYIILRESAVPGDAEDTWVGVGTIEAASANAAVRAYMDTKDATGGTYVAVPARSWRPVTVEIKTQSVVVLRDGK